MEHDEIWNIDDVAAYLKMPVSGVRELCRSRSQERMTTPLPMVKIHSKAIRFRRADVEQWVSKLASTQSLSN